MLLISNYVLGNKNVTCLLLPKSDMMLCFISINYLFCNLIDVIYLI